MPSSARGYLERRTAQDSPPKALTVSCPPLFYDLRLVAREEIDSETVARRLDGGSFINSGKRGQTPSLGQPTSCHNDR